MSYLPTFSFRDIVRYSIIATVVVILAGYTTWQARLLLTGPVIEITEIPPTVQHDREVEIAGYASNITGITLNGKNIYTDKNGYFQEDVILENGYTVITLEGKDRYGRTSSVVKEFVYQKQATTSY